MLISTFHKRCTHGFQSWKFFKVWNLINLPVILLLCWIYRLQNKHQAIHSYLPLHTNSVVFFNYDSQLIYGKVTYRAFPAKKDILGYHVGSEKHSVCLPVPMTLPSVFPGWLEETHVRVSCRTSQTIRVSPVTSQTCDLLCLVPPCPRLYYISLHHSTIIRLVPPSYLSYATSHNMRHTNSTTTYHAYHCTYLA